MVLFCFVGRWENTYLGCLRRVNSSEQQMHLDRMWGVSGYQEMASLEMDQNFFLYRKSIQTLSIVIGEVVGGVGFGGLIPRDYG